jgi:hypothetical protein
LFDLEGPGDRLHDANIDDPTDINTIQESMGYLTRSDTAILVDAGNDILPVGQADTQLQGSVECSVGLPAITQHFAGRAALSYRDRQGVGPAVATRGAASRRQPKPAIRTPWRSRRGANSREGFQNRRFVQHAPSKSHIRQTAE